MDNREIDDNGWDRWKNHVLIELQDNKLSLLNMNTKLDRIDVNIAKLQVKSGVWGLLGGLVPVLIMLIVMYMKAKGA